MVYRITVIANGTARSHRIVTDMTADEIRSAWEIVYPTSAVVITRLR